MEDLKDLNSISKKLLASSVTSGKPLSWALLPMCMRGAGSLRSCQQVCVARTTKKARSFMYCANSLRRIVIPVLWGHWCQPDIRDTKRLCSDYCMASPPWYVSLCYDGEKGLAGSGLHGAMFVTWHPQAPSPSRDEAAIPDNIVLYRRIFLLHNCLCGS